MCEACSEDLKLPRVSARRRKLWEMTNGWHCSVIGTCLTLADLRSLGRKLNLTTDQTFPEDYQLHGYFVGEAEKSDSKAAKMLGKLLDKRHAAAVRKVRPLRDVAALEQRWHIALETGDIPGPYWAILSHPFASEKLCERMFADVHMLSHLVGASNRADIRQIQVLEENIDTLQDRLRRICVRHRQRLRSLREELTSAKAARDAAGTCPPAKLFAQKMSEAERFARQERDLVLSAMADVKRRADDAEKACSDQGSEIVELKAKVAELEAENAALEQHVAATEDNVPDMARMDLEGQRVLYVGGRKSSINHLRAVIEDCNGTFAHHDGGLEKSIDELAAAIVRADTVLFPTDCVSHEAANKVKRLCNQQHKTYVPLRTCGVGSLMAGLGQSLNDDLPMAAE